MSAVQIFVPFCSSLQVLFSIFFLLSLLGIEMNLSQNGTKSRKREMKRKKNNSNFVTTADDGDVWLHVLGCRVDKL